MTSVVQISIIDHADLIGGAIYGVELSVSEIAADFGLQAERSFDDHGYFDMLCLEFRGARLGFQHRFDDPEAGTMVCLADVGGANPVGLIAEVCNLGIEEVLVFEDPSLSRTAS